MVLSTSHLRKKDCYLHLKIMLTGTIISGSKSLLKSFEGESVTDWRCFFQNVFILIVLFGLWLTKSSSPMSPHTLHSFSPPSCVEIAATLPRLFEDRNYSQEAFCPSDYLLWLHLGSFIHLNFWVFYVQCNKLVLGRLEIKWLQSVTVNDTIL